MSVLQRTGLSRTQSEGLYADPRQVFPENTPRCVAAPAALEEAELWSVCEPAKASPGLLQNQPSSVNAASRAATVLEGGTVVTTPESSTTGLNARRGQLLLAQLLSDPVHSKAFQISLNQDRD